MTNYSAQYKLVFLVMGLALIPFLVSAQLTLPNPLGNTTTFAGLISNIFTYLLNILASLAVLMIVYGGIVLLTSAGNESKIGNAKKILFYAVVGLGVALLGTGLIELIKYIVTGS